MNTALIWGADGGIGLAVAQLLAEQGWQVLAACRHPERLVELTGLAFEVDVSKPHSVQAAVTRIGMEVTQVELWVYAVGDIQSKRIAEQQPEEWQQILAANLTGAYLATHHSLPLLAENAHLFYLGAVSERMRLPGLGAYAAAKAGLEAFAEVVRKESRKKVSVVRPGAVDTPFWQKVPFKLPAHHLTPRQVAEKVLAAYAAGHSGALDL